MGRSFRSCVIDGKFFYSFFHMLKSSTLYPCKHKYLYNLHNAITPEHTHLLVKNALTLLNEVVASSVTIMGFQDIVIL